ncbi:interferon-induced very large GTPase 1-like [Colossoma macropomum]|uniref:interferon-induced very large GTPase 1-like n=1 Tax=Colossoma macropomum TaxID=42526 RepID=UPI0018644238|nr:interferon-induced very large GTPase 1-like [Colossoma macropomum]
MEKEVQDLTVVLFGNSSAVGDENILLGQPTADVADFSVIVPKSKKISGRIVNLINILDLQDNALHVDRAIVRLVQENKIHAFVFVLQLGHLTDADKVGLEWLQKKFGESVLRFVMILFTYEKLEDCDTIIDDLKKNPVLVHLVEKCGDRYHTCSKNMNNQSEMKTLLEKIDYLISENNQRCYTAELYNTASNLREDRLSQQSRLPASDSQLPKYKTAGTVSKQITEKEKVSKNPLRKTFKSLPHTTWFWKKERNLSRENIELDGAEHTQHNNEEKAVGKITSEKTDQLFTRLELKRNEKQRIKSADILQITSPPLHCQKPCTEKELVQMFIKRLLLMDHRARNISITDGASEVHHRQSTPANKCGEKKLANFLKKNPSLNKATSKNSVHPMDVQMAVFHHSDSFLKQLIVTKLSQCQYALPLLVPNPFTGEIEFPLWTFRQIKKSWMTCNTTGKKTSKMIPMHEAETPMVFFFRLGSISSSKSQLINDLINERHKTFFHRNCLGSTRDRLLMDGVVEIAWYCPSGKSTDQFTDCVAFCNLHGDAENHKKQLEILTEMSSMNVVVLGNQDDSTTDNEALENLFEGAKPLICLLSDDDSTVSWTENLKCKIGLKDRNQAVVSKELRETIKECFSTSLSTFSLKKLGKNKDISIDENKEECQKGKEAAMQIMLLLERTELTTVKETYLPCQGKLWHKWCQKKKELHRLKGHNIQIQKSEKQAEMKEIRRQQHEHELSELIELFIRTMNSLTENEKCYFLKWLGILLDNSTTDELSGFRQAYDLTWSKVLDLKGQADKSEEMKAAQTQLEEISQKLSAASFGMEHILREMGQIYESLSSVQVAKKDFTLPKIAAEVMLSGHPLELMDGDTGHVPLDWVSAVLDELIKKLGDKRVFVLSVLGIQSSGKSTMLNAMFGLQFAVSAGRCTKGAFMQLVKVSEEMKEELKFDYIVVVDTEGLRAPELTGMSTRQQDNGLATFVVGLGNMTLINIFGENPAEMQDILQIVVQAFMRMKKVRLNPSCMFVHQNVGEITAGERNMEGRKRFLDKLDEMTKLAAKEEDCNAKCFSDVIEFDVKSDVWYFTQLWEGSPPMAPPNPLYSENIQELKSNIILKISKKRGVTLSEFKGNFSSLWNALLDENFVFSFRNILEIALYRKLEHEYSKWTWSLRSAMLAIENRLHNRVSNENSLKIDEKDIVECMKETKTVVETSIKKFFNEDRDKEILIQWQERFQRKIVDLCNELVEGTKRKLDDIIRLKITREKVDCEKKMYENELFKLSKDLAFCLKNKETEEDALEKEFEDVWSKWVTELTPGTPSFGDINIWGDVTQILSESCEINLVCERQNQGTYKRIDALGDYSDYVILKKQEDFGQENLPSSNKQGEEDDNNACAFGQVLKDEEHSLYEENCRTNTFTADDNNSLTDLITNTVTDIKAEIQKVPIAERGYSRIYIAEIIASVKHKVEAYECRTSGFILKKEFTVDLCLYVCSFAAKQFAELHKEFKEAYDVRLYLEKQRPQYFNIFKNYCNGATSTAVFGQLIVDTLEPSILQAAYDQTAIDLSEKMKRDVPAFNGNRSNLEKHILTSLAEEESFENYIQYIQKPREYFKYFIKKIVKGYVLNENCQVVLETIKSNIISKGKCVVDAVNEATEKIKSSNGDVSMWLQHLSRKLQDELQFKEKSCSEQKEITDLDFLREVVIKGLNNIIPKLSNSFQDISDLKWEMFRKKPDDILIEHLCRCCWAQCPFCNAICTNTMEDHTGDHSVRFHRNCGTNGWSYILKNELGIEFCTTLVLSDLHFRANDKVLYFKDYRTAGGEYARWNISPDNSEMPYWKWFVCRFQEDLEKHYKKKFIGHGEIPSEWRDCFKDKAIESLSEL